MNRTTHMTAHQSAHPASSIRWINLGLGFAALMLLLYYVMQVNAMAAQGWEMRDANDRVSALHDQRNALVAEQASLDDRQSLAALAKQEGLVPAGDVVYLVQDHAVAAAR